MLAVLRVFALWIWTGNMKRSVFPLYCLLLLSACGGGGGPGGGQISAPVNNPPVVTPPVQGCSANVSRDLAFVWPGTTWLSASPESAGICPGAIEDAMNYAFASGNDTGAVLVVRDGFIVAERYATDRDAESLATSWSVAKSVTSALMGVLRDEGGMAMDQSMADFIPSWAGTDKAAITVDHLMTVRTALEILGDDDGDGYPDGAPLYAAADQLALSIDRPLQGTPGDVLYTYSNADVMVAGEVLRVGKGVNAADYFNAVMSKIGFAGDWWTDSAGHVLTYCCLDATPRSFARFGLLYARKGLWADREVFSQEWWQKSTLPARSGSYGYYWWPLFNNGFAALGVQGQMIAVYPDDDLVVLRFGRYTRRGDGSTIVGGGNYHETTEPDNFDTGQFLGLIRAGLDIPGPRSGGTVDLIPPVADVGLDQISLRSSQVTVSGRASGDGDGREVTNIWKVTDPDGVSVDVTIDNKLAYFMAEKSGSYNVKLMVIDSGFNRAEDSMQVEVVESRDVLTAGTQQGMWPNYGGDLSSAKYSPLGQITKENINNLEVAWRWRSPDNDLTSYQNSVFEATPIMIDGVLYTSTSFSQVAAINALTGATIWNFDPQSYRYGRPPNNGFLHRGLSYAEKGGRKLVHMPTGDARLIALDAISGEPVSDFGPSGNGSVSLLEGIPRLDVSTRQLNNAHDQPDVPDLAGVVSQVGNSSPGIMCRNVLVLGSSVHDGVVLPPAPPGDVRGFDPDTGELLWTFHTVPREGEFGTDSWGGESWRINGNTNVWAPMSADETLGHVYVPVGCPTNNYYGGRRPGDNLFANSVVALNCETGERIWHFQTVHHDIWDYDLPAAPNLIDITVGGTPVKALAQVSKQGFVYVFNRETGEPVWPINEVPVPSSSVPGEVAALTQPIPSWPPPFVRQGSNREDLISPASAAEYDVGPLYTPPTTRGLIVTPGEGGGANWGGASYDPTTQILYVNGFGPLTHVVKLQDGGEPDFFYVFPELFFGPATGSPYKGGEGSRITAYDMNTGNILWQVPGDSDPTVIGNAASMVSGGLLYYKNSSLQTLNVFDAASGTLLRKVPLGGYPTSVPMTYEVDGRQFVVIALGKGDELMELVALNLSE